MTAIPKNAAAIILLKDKTNPKVFWVKRSEKLMFMPGFHAFPGGQVDPEDIHTPITHCETEEGALMRSAAAREFFEETGVLLAPGAGEIAGDKLMAHRQALHQKSKTFKQILEEENLVLDCAGLEQCGRWVTPPMAPRRFDTFFYLAWLEDSQEPHIEEGELTEGEWIQPVEAFQRWQSGEIMMAPPTLHIIQTLAKNCSRPETLKPALQAISLATNGDIRRMEFKPGFFLWPVKTPTLPPATHTNCYIAGGNEMVVIDPASPYPEEQATLDTLLDGFIAEGRRVREIIVTHHHPDHIGGVNYLSKRLGVGVAAHKLTAERLEGQIEITRYLQDNELIEFDDLPEMRLRVLHTPGHTRGHLCFYEETRGYVITGDLVVGIGTVVIDPPEGNMKQYFHSLERLLALPKLTSLYGAHGPAIANARAKIEEYITHRTARENKIFAAIASGAHTLEAIVLAAYTDVQPELYPLARRSTIAHLEKLEEEGRVSSQSGEMYRAANQR